MKCFRDHPIKTLRQINGIRSQSRKEQASFFKISFRKAVQRIKKKNWKKIEKLKKIFLKKCGENSCQDGVLSKSYQ